MELKQIKEKKVRGDNVLAAKMLGISADNVYQALKRPGSKHHDAACKAMIRIINNREELLTNE